MSKYNDSKYADADAFGRLRTSDPTTIFDSQLQYNDQPLLWYTVGTGTAAHVAAKAAVQLSVAAGESIMRQSKAYHRYQPGKSQLIFCTGVLGAAVAGVTKRIGYFDNDNGVFFEVGADGLHVVLRSDVTGSVVDRRVARSGWNMAWNDKDSLRLSQDIDASKAQIFVIDLEWLGVGRVRVGFVVDGYVFYVHEFNHANLTTAVYMRTANLPVRYEMVSTTGAADDMFQICSTVVSEGGFREELGQRRSVANGATGITVAARRSVLAIRPKATFNNIVNRGTIIPEQAALFVTIAAAYYEVVYGGVLGGTPSWTSAGDNSLVEFDIAGTTVTGGEVIDSGYVAISGSGGGARGSSTSSLLSKLPLVLDAAGANPISLALVVTGVGGNPVSHAALTWREIY
jgi:hypothetical protein